MKSNTTPIFTMIELYRLTRNDYWRREISSWIDSALKKFTDENLSLFILGYFKQKRIPSLVAGFILIDVLCDSYVFVNKEQSWIDAASKISKQCLSWSWANYLIPMGPNTNFNHIDGQVDFSISIRKLSEIIGNSKLRNHSFKIMEAVLNIQKAKKDFIHIFMKMAKIKILGKIILIQNIMDYY